MCHQTVSLVARHLEASGIPTVIMGCARDIVEHCVVPRFLFSDFPLGNAAGRPHDAASQDLTLELALSLLEQATAANADGAERDDLVRASSGRQHPAQRAEDVVADARSRMREGRDVVRDSHGAL